MTGFCKERIDGKDRPDCQSDASAVSRQDELLVLCARIDFNP
ncbi:MAG: hypothetical protein AAF530_20150 [Pseudomonadota bacterium]